MPNTSSPTARPVPLKSPPSTHPDRSSPGTAGALAMNLTGATPIAFTSTGLRPAAATFTSTCDEVGDGLGQFGSRRRTSEGLPLVLYAQARMVDTAKGAWRGGRSASVRAGPVARARAVDALEKVAEEGELGVRAAAVVERVRAEK